MIKKISEMTAEDKAAYLAAVKESTEKEQGVSWEWMEKQIRDDIDATFDDERFVKMDPDFRIDAAYARKEFGNKKPDLVDYLLWVGKFVTKSEYVQW